MEVPFAQGPVGRTNYRQTLPLAPGEVVLTFDDGPMPRRTTAVLDALRAECVKATFFVVGTMVAAYPDILRRTAAEGHTIATHTWSHAYLHRTRSAVVQRDQISGGLLAARAVLGDDDPSLSSFFRYPGLGHTQALDRYVGAQHLIPFSIDVDGEDWKRVSPAQVVDRVMGRLDTLGRGIILLHDIQARTVAILPELLRQLKANGYRVVHVTGLPEDTRQALNVSEPPRSERIQVALSRLNQQQAVRVAAREAEPDPSSPSAAAVAARSTGERASRIQVASAERDGPEPMAPSVRDDAPAGQPVVLRRSLDLPGTAASPMREPAIAAATEAGRPGSSGSVAGRDASAPPPRSVTMQAEPTLAALQGEAKPDLPPPTQAAAVRVTAAWIDPPTRMTASPSGLSANPPAIGVAAKAAPEPRPSRSARMAPLAPAGASSLDAAASASASKPAPVKAAAPEPLPTALAALEERAGPETAIDRPPSATPADPAPRPGPSPPIARPDAMPGITQAGTGSATARLAASPAEASPATGQRHGGFVVLAVASGTGPSFREITMRR